MLRVPASYLASATGIQTNGFTAICEMQNIDKPEKRTRFGDLDGVMYSWSRVRMRQITDGTSKTMLIGEALHDVAAQEAYGWRAERDEGDHKDHWYIGSNDLDISRRGAHGLDVSEAMGSLGVPINYQDDFPRNSACISPGSPRSEDCQKVQLAFGSAHVGGFQMVRSDGSVDFVQENVDANIRRDLATRASQTAATACNAAELVASN